MSKSLKFAALAVAGVSASIFLSEIAWGQAHFNYMPRNYGEYHEGQRRERPISGIDMELKSLRVRIAEGVQPQVEQTTGQLHLAFTLPADYEPRTHGVDIVIHGPKRYLLDRVNRDFTAGYNVFSWSSVVADGLNLLPEDLEPRMYLTGDLFIPCFLYQAHPLQMPEAEAIHALLEANTEGSLRYFLRDAGRLIVEGQHDIFPGVPVEIPLPVASEYHHFDLHVILEYEVGQNVRSIRRCFPINSLRTDSGSSEAQ